MGRKFILAVALASALFAALATSATQAQESPPGGAPGCAPEETCVDPVAPCPTDDPTITCVAPDCPKDTPCTTPPGGPGCPDGTVCIDPVPCPDDMACPEPPPCEVKDGTPCEVFDTDSDGWDNYSEMDLGSDPNDANSTPEHGYILETCQDGVDNDGDATTDLADDGCHVDSDEDGRIDAQDNCPWDPNADQADRDGDGTGDACDYDADNDGWDDFTEAEWGSNPNDANSTPEHWFARETCEDGRDNDGDGATDSSDAACAPDNDYDTVPDERDNCPTYWNQDQADGDGDGTGDACEDSDGDGFVDGDETGSGSDPNDASSTPEGGVRYDACEDGIDNDLDGTVDQADEGCRIAYDGGAIPPSTSGPFEILPAARDIDETAGERTTNAPALPLAGLGTRSDTETPWWLVAVAAAAVALIAGSSTFGLRARQRR